MHLRPVAVALLLCSSSFAADVPSFRNPNAGPPSDPKVAAALDPAKDLPRYPAVEPKDALATWKVKPGFKVQFVTHEPQVRDPIAISFDENGRMFVCEMIDYSEERDQKPHLGRISLLEGKDGDGYYETSTIFADNLPWPTGLIWANGGLYVGATPDIWRLEDHDGDGRAEVRKIIYTGFGTGLKALNVQTMFNCFQWGQDNRIHVQSGSGNRGVIQCLVRPDLPAQELATRDFWFDPKTHDFGFEAGGAQFGMSFDNYGRKFACSNSDHLQFWVYDERYASRNPFFAMPGARQSIAADGGAAEVFRISPDEPWRIVRTRWRIAGVVKGVVEGGGRVSGYFTGASGTMVYRGDAYGDDFVNNTFSGDSGSALGHRKKIYPDGVSLIGRRPADESNYEFVASTDTWARVVNFSNAPDGTLHICDMYREIIEHPWSLPEEIKKHLDLNSGNNRGRIYRIVPDNADWKRRPNPKLGSATTAELVATLAHSNGWHRDTASRLLWERQDKTAIPLLAKLVAESPSPLARHHALGTLVGLGALNEDALVAALADRDPRVRERAVYLAEMLLTAPPSPRLAERLNALTEDPDARVRFQLALTLPSAPALSAAFTRIAIRDSADTWISSALLSAPPKFVTDVLLPAFTRDLALAKKSAPFVAKLIEIRAASKPAEGYAALIEFIAQPGASPLWFRALGDGLRRAGTTIESADTAQKLAAAFTRAATTAADPKTAVAARLDAIELLQVAPYTVSREPLIACLAPAKADEVQVAAIKSLSLHATPAVTAALVRSWTGYTPRAKETALAALVAREDRATALLEAVKAGSVKADEISATQVQSLVHHKNTKISALAKVALASVLPPSRAEVTAKFQPSLTLTGDAKRGHDQFVARCFMCHQAAGEGMVLGPDMLSVKSRGREGILTAILDPSKEVAPQYIAYDVITKDGNTYTGMISRDEAATLTLKIMGGVEIPLPRSNIRGSSSGGKSLMPDGLEANMTVQEMADLLTFIETLK